MMLTAQHQDDAVTVHADEMEISRAAVTPTMPAEQVPKPHLHPLRTRGGVVITGFQPKGHPWHHGLQFAIPRVGDHNLWGGPTYVDPEHGYQMLNNQGTIHSESAGLEETSEGPVLTQHLKWYGNDTTPGTGSTLLAETRTLGWRGTTSGWLLEFTSELTNITTSPLTLATPAQRGRIDGGYGGLWLRLAPDLTITAVEGQEGPAESGSISDWLVIHAVNSDDAAITLVAAQGPGWPTDRRRWVIRPGVTRPGVIRQEDPRAIGWAFCYDEELCLGPGERVRLSHQLSAHDGLMPVTDAIGEVKAVRNPTTSRLTGGR